MQTLLIIFVALVLAFSLFCVVVVCCDIIEEKHEHKMQEVKEDAQVTLEASTVANVENEIVEQNDENVKFTTGNETLLEKYNALSSKYKEYYDEIVEFAGMINNIKHFKKAQYEDFRLGKRSLVRLKIRRGVVVCELMIPNLQFKNYVNDNKVVVKQAPAVIKVTDGESLSAVKDSIRIAVDAIEEEKAYKKEKARIRRNSHRHELTKDKASMAAK